MLLFQRATISLNESKGELRSDNHHQNTCHLLASAAGTHSGAFPIQLLTCGNRSGSRNRHAVAERMDQVSSIHFHKPEVLGQAAFIYGTIIPCWHFMVWSVKSLDPGADDHLEIKQVGGSHEIGRLLERLMKEAPVDWVCLVSTDETGEPNELLAQLALEGVMKARKNAPHQKAFRVLTDSDLAEGEQHA